MRPANYRALLKQNMILERWGYDSRLFMMGMLPVAQLGLMK